MAHTGRPAFEAEARSIAAMFETPTSHNLIRVFLLQDRLKAQSTVAAGAVKAVHVVGAGGHGRRYRGLVCAARLRCHAAGPDP